MTVKEMLTTLLASASELITGLEAEDFEKSFSQYTEKVRTGVHTALYSYIASLELFSSMSAADIFDRISTNVDDSHTFFVVMLTVFFSVWTTFVGVNEKRSMVVRWPSATVCVFFLIVSPIRNNTLVKQTEDIYEAETMLSGMDNFMSFARHIDLHLIVISFVLASILLYFYNILKYIPALWMVFWPWSVFISKDSGSADYMMFCVFAVFVFYIYSRIYNALERIVLATVFSFGGSFILVAHVNIANAFQEFKCLPGYEEFLRNFSLDHEHLYINNIYSILFLLVFVLGLYAQLGSSPK